MSAHESAVAAETLTEAERRAPVNGSPHGTVAWSEHEDAWRAYARTHDGQSAERIAQRGGFGLVELVTQLGRMPSTWRPDDRTRFMRGVEPTAQPADLTARLADPDVIETACVAMHDAYETAAVRHGWATQERSRKPWADVPEANKATMRDAVAAALAAAVRDALTGGA